MTGSAPGRDVQALGHRWPCHENVQHAFDLRELVELHHRNGRVHRLAVFLPAHHDALRRAFEFEYSVSGDDRYAGSVVLEGREVVLVDVSAHRLAHRAVVVNLH